MRRASVAVVMVCALRALSAGPDSLVRVWEDTIELPTYAEDAPNPNPPFDMFALTRFNYPYTLRDALRDRRTVQRGRALHLDSGYLPGTALPGNSGPLNRS